MRNFYVRLSLLVIFLLPVSLSAQSAGPAPARRAVVVELFTSEGCNTCPPADALLSKLRQAKLSDGTEIIPLGLHVDYWNHLGWTDRFSSSSYTGRQREYVDKL